MVMRDKVHGRTSFAVLLGAGLLALVALPAWTLGQAGATKDLVVQTATDTADPAAGDRERRIQELEEKVQLLLRELQALRAHRQRPALMTDQPRPDTSAARDPVMGLRLVQPDVKVQGQAPARATARLAPVEVREVRVGRPLNLVVAADAGPVSEVTLSRATYRLPKDQAEALVKFLQETIKPSVLEAKVEKETVVVTTTPAAQRVVAQLIALMKGQVPGGAELHGYQKQ
jgi:hypothetical protein